MTEKVRIESTQPIGLRPATWNDLDALAGLMVQLYNAEQPGGLRGPPGGPHALMRYLIERGGVEGLRGRYVAVDGSGTPIGSASLRFYGDPEAGLLPPGLFAVASRELGPLNALRLFGAMLRTTLTPETAIDPQCAYIHSVVIDGARRRRGAGRAMMGAIEQLARQRGAHSAMLRVFRSNSPARSLYTQIGYVTVGRTPPWMDWFTLPSEVMRKAL